MQIGGLQILYESCKEQHKTHRKTVNDSLFEFFWKNSSRPLTSSNSTSSSFLVCFEWFKTWWVCQLRLYQKKLNSKGKDALIEDFMFKTLIYFSSPIIKHWTPLHQKNYIFFIPLPNFTNFATLETLGGSLQTLLMFHK